MRSMPCPLEKRLSKLRKDGTAIPLRAFYQLLIPVRAKDKKREYSRSRTALKNKNSVRYCKKGI